MPLSRAIAMMDKSLALARAAASANEVPVGAVVTLGDRIVGQGANRPIAAHDPTAHAEIIAIREASAALGRDRLSDCDLYVTLEPCAMCAGAIAHARIRRLYYAAPDSKGGAVMHGPRLFQQPTIHHRPEVYAGIGEEEAAAMLRAFFAERR